MATQSYEELIASATKIKNNELPESNTHDVVFSTFDKAYLFGACLTIISMLYFNGKVAPHYHKNKLR